MASLQSTLQSPAAQRLASLLKHFPPVTYAFAYGSGVHHQPGLYEPSRQEHRPRADATAASSAAAGQAQAASSSPGAGDSKSRSRGPVIDFIFAVNDAHQWHHQNLQRNPEHYSWVGRLGANTVCGIAEAVGVGVHFNTLVPLDPQTTIKYGVVEASALQQDLTAWSHLYIAGRMHKPVTTLTPPALLPPALAAAELANRHHALATALVLLPPTFTEEELLRTVVGLSYRGDIRLAVGAEDPHKVSRIVAGSWEQLHGMYLPLLAESQRYSSMGVESTGQRSSGEPGGALWRQAKDPAAQEAALRLLPAGLLHEMAARLGYHVPPEHLDAGESTQAEVVAAALKTGQPQRLAADSLAAIVRRSSIYQAAAGLLAAGGGKAAQYVAAKVSKAVKPLLAAAAARKAS